MRRTSGIDDALETGNSLDGKPVVDVIEWRQVCFSATDCNVSVNNVQGSVAPFHSANNKKLV